MSILETIRRPWESKTDYKIRTGKGQIAYLYVPSQDGRMDPATGVWGPSLDVYREDDRLYDMFKDQYPDRMVEIPAGCHHDDGRINWNKVAILREGSNSNELKIVLEF